MHALIGFEREVTRKQREKLSEKKEKEKKRRRRRRKEKEKKGERKKDLVQCEEF